MVALCVFAELRNSNFFSNIEIPVSSQDDKKGITYHPEKIPRASFFAVVSMLLLTCTRRWRPEAPEKRFIAAIDADGVQQVQMTGGEYYFDPNVVVVKINVPVELHIKKAAPRYRAQGARGGH